MIRILAKDYTQALETLCNKLDREASQYDLYISRDSKLLSKHLVESVKFDTLILVGDTGNWCATFAEAFGLALVYDKKFAEKHIKEFCKLSNTPVPAQYVLDKYCMLPESFIHYASVYGFQCGCGGVYDKCHVYVLPDDNRECALLFDNYIAKDLYKIRGNAQHFCYKLFGLSKRDLEEKLSKLAAKFVSQHCETNNLDSKVILTFPRNCPKKAVCDYVDKFTKQFANYIYATAETSLQKVAVEALSERYKTVATAESITGGQIASSIVDVAGASAVLYEGAVTYSINSKCNRLGINPHFIDEYGVVSAQVAKEMALSQLQNADYSIATTGFAGPTADGKNPVGLCFVAIGAKIHGKNHVKVYKNVYSGDRSSIRNQVTNTALYLLINTVKQN
ncbi:MAG: nicotinamide-nucleotide amidohydrolase family protein [Corallococcus sp.]|nr:nicotinamide-nucleotide amidohydrolase family protein [Corallococcus sp.]MCM1359158.1 nicotinamide-nucleotide amidohydrolase family protein [Corallococcus sp.]MCM1394548.1 nicotinamide-nucleotide amidohydrolase family protein [Corallococcus sp.]